MCSLHLTHPSAHTWSSGQPTCAAPGGAVGGSVPCPRVSPQSWTLPARAGIRTHNLGLPRVSSLMDRALDLKPEVTQGCAVRIPALAGSVHSEPNVI